mmetsp:Transcript_4543/g.6055  ORF Transcript_4543/g.6055 Transcript_4543/m.6055 type:complete len:124 (-) Transcript_4543:183-554(-)
MSSYYNSERHYCYVNSVVDGNNLEHAVKPFDPLFGSRFFGYMIIISPQSDAVATYGLDAHQTCQIFILALSLSKPTASTVKAKAMDTVKESMLIFPTTNTLSAQLVGEMGKFAVMGMNLKQMR